MEMEVEIILFVSDLTKSKAFYQELLSQKPILDVPGMTEFKLGNFGKLGLMASNGIARILGDKIPHPDSGKGIPRCELYFRIDNLEHEFEAALNSGATLISPIQDRDWGDKAGYMADPDGNIIAFATPIL